MKKSSNGKEAKKESEPAIPYKVLAEHYFDVSNS